MKKCRTLLGICFLAIGIPFRSCDEPNTLEEINVDYGFDRIRPEYDYTVCLENEILKYPDSYEDEYVKSNPWLTRDDLISIAAFSEELMELSFVQNQAALEIKKRLLSPLGSSDLELNCIRIVREFLYRKTVKIDGEVITKLNLDQMEQIAYTLGAYNSGRLKKSAAFSIESDEGNYVFHVVSQFAEPMGEIVGSYESILTLRSNSDSLILERRPSIQQALLDYYLIPVERPCTKGQKIYAPIAIAEGVKVYYGGFH